MRPMFRRLFIVAGAAVLFVRVDAFGQTPASAPGSAAGQAPASVPAQEFTRTVPYEERIALQGRVQRLTSREAVDLALRYNLDIAIERFNGRLAEQAIVSAKGYYDPSLSFSAARGSERSPQNGASGGATIPSLQLDSTSFGPGLRQNLPGGGSAAVSLSSSSTMTSSTTPTVNPVVTSSFGAALTQPLLRGFLVTAADRQIGLARIDADLAASQYRQRQTSVVQQVLTQYWELEYAIGVYNTRCQSKDLAVVQYEGTKLRVQNGLLPPIALTAARAEIASRERDILDADVRVIVAENALKLLLSQDPASPIWDTALLPIDKPVLAGGDLTLERAMALATARRPELEQLRLQIAQNAIDLTFYRREKLPTVNLAAGLTSAGRSGTALMKIEDVQVPDPTNPTYGGYERAWRQVFGFQFPAWTLGVTVQVPLGNRKAAAQFEQANLIRSRLDTQKTKTLQAVQVDVRFAVQVIATQSKNVDAARLTTQLFTEQLEGETARYTAGFSNDFELRRFQRDLVDAQVRELRALVDLQLAGIALQRATDTLLEAYGTPAAKQP